MTFLRIAISTFFIVAPGIAYFSGMDPKVVVGFLVLALWGFISISGEGALGLTRIDAYGPLSPYNQDTGDDITTNGKIAGGVVACLAGLLLFFAASSYIKNKNKQPDPIATATPSSEVTPSSDPTPVATQAPVVVETPVAVETPKVTETPATGSTPQPAATSAPVDIEFEKLKIKAEEKVLSRDYKGATAILDELEKQAPNNVEVLFYRFLVHQGLNKDDEAKEYAEKILKEHPRSRYERRLNKFLGSLELAKKRKKLGGDRSSYYAIDKGASIELASASKLAEAGSPALDEVTGSQIGLELLSGEPAVQPLNLPEGTSVTPYKSVHFFLRLNTGEFSWERSRNTRGAAEVDLVYVKVLSGKQKGKQGWLVNTVKGMPSSEENPGTSANNILSLPVIR